jgi:hypothetical protein
MTCTPITSDPAQGKGKTGNTEGENSLKSGSWQDFSPPFSGRKKARSAFETKGCRMIMVKWRHIGGRSPTYMFSLYIYLSPLSTGLFSFSFSENREQREEMSYRKTHTFSTQSPGGPDTRWLSLGRAFEFGATSCRSPEFSPHPLPAF